MKTMITTLALMLLTITTVRAQEPTMEDNLNEAYAIMDTAKTMPSFIKASAKFDLIANKYQDQWVAQYYAGYTKCIISYMEENVATKDLIVDEAEAFLDRILALGTENDHVYILKALVANSRMAVDGASRWKEYTPIFEDNLKKAKEINENNPHIYYLKAVSIFFTPKMFGGGEKNAKPYFEKAIQKYALMTERVITIPYWGEVQTADFMKQIND